MCSAKAVTRSIRKGSVTGFTSEATAMSTSIFATAGRMKKFFRGSSLSTRPLPLASSEISTLSPTSGDEPSSRKRPRAPALDRFGFSFDVVEAAQGFDYDALHQSAK